MALHLVKSMLDILELDAHDESMWWAKWGKRSGASVGVTGSRQIPPRGNGELRPRPELATLLDKTLSTHLV